MSLNKSGRKFGMMMVSLSCFFVCSKPATLSKVSSHFRISAVSMMCLA